MKLKYYLRGLGLGILVTALILGLTGNPEMTDAQIRERALELGMVDKTNMTLSEVRTEEATVSEEEESDEVSASASEETGEESVASGEEETEEAGSESISTADEEKDDEIKASADEESVYEGSEATGEAATAPVTITIVRGDSSVSVSRDLAEAGLVDSAKAFDAYLCGNGYDKRISVGSFQIYPGSTYEEIAKIISRSK